MKNVRIGIALSLFAALAVGCKKKPGAAGSASGSGAASGATAAAPAAAVPTPDEPDEPDEGAEGRKVNAYIECSNRFAQRAHQAADRYAEWVDLKKGPTASGPVLGTYTLVGDLDRECRKKLADAKAQPPAMPELEQAGDRFVTALGALEPLLVDASDYYSGGVYKTDAMKHGQELHPTLVAAFSEFKAADEVIDAQLDAFEDKSLAAAMAAREKSDGRTMPFLTLQIIVTGKKVMRLAAAGGDAAHVDAAALAPAVDALTAAITELQTYGHANKVGDATASIFVSSTAPAFAKQAQALLHHAKEKAPFESGDKMLIENGNPEMVTGTPQAVIKAYNDVIEASNQM
ncbi:MAG: YiiG family protein [Deltaproteobacteria bacterium]|nr:YiiG family protein [Deltaproteobacteria bacterium]